MLAVRRAQSRTEYLNYVYWVPLSWAGSIIVQARKSHCCCINYSKEIVRFSKAHDQGYMSNSKYVVDVNNELAALRNQCGTVISYDWISLPLVYTQVDSSSP